VQKASKEQGSSSSSSSTSCFTSSKSVPLQLEYDPNDPADVNFAALMAAFEARKLHADEQQCCSTSASLSFLVEIEDSQVRLMPEGSWEGLQR